LIDKLKEELDEFYQATERADKIVELADVQEVINAFTIESGFTIAQREQVRTATYDIAESNRIMHIDVALASFVEATNMTEKLEALAYMQQTLQTMILAADITLAEVDRARFEKLRQRGAFLKHIFLISTEE
jgi:predicted house-cleaning noncanonical NTP pyrophosphatase (MazG superfamily)